MKSRVELEGIISTDDRLSHLIMALSRVQFNPNMSELARIVDRPPSSVYEDWKKLEGLFEFTIVIKPKLFSKEENK